MSDKTSSQPLVTGLLRGLSVLRCFDHGRERLGSSDIARMTGLPQPTVWRLCKTLEHGGYLFADRDGKRFRPGLPILTLGYAALDTLELAELARPLLEEVATEFKGACGLSTPEGTHMLFVQRFEAPRAYLNFILRVGSEVPVISSGTGWAYLAGLSEPERGKLLTQCRKADPVLYREKAESALAAVTSYATSGFISNVDVFFPGLATVAAPLTKAGRWTPYVLNCTTATPVLADAEVRQRAGAALVRVAEQLLPIAVRLEADA
jgi:DNA-binding IclR family transcriptional regulator